VLERRLAEVRWDNQNIVVLDQVTIVPPYRVDDCSAADANSQALQHVRKLVTNTICQFLYSKKHSRYHKQSDKNILHRKKKIYLRISDLTFSLNT